MEWGRGFYFNLWSLDFFEDIWIEIWDQYEDKFEIEIGTVCGTKKLAVPASIRRREKRAREGREEKQSAKVYE